jgi:hypothetical protein
MLALRIGLTATGSHTVGVFVDLPPDFEPHF